MKILYLQFLKSNKFFFLIFLFFAATSFHLYGFSNGELHIVTKGHSDYSIILSKKASKVEVFAADELQQILKRISGVLLPVLNEGTSRSIYIGEYFAKSNEIDMRENKLGFDGFVMKSIGNNIFLAGLKGRGTLYAVYSFLRKIGCRWYAPDFEFYGKWGGAYIPQKTSIQLPNLNVISKPDYKYRKEYVEEGRTHTVASDKKLIAWMSKVGMNTFVYPLDYDHQGRVVWDSVRKELIPELERRGMLVEVGGHGYQNYLPPSKYFEDHPNWFGLRNGKRSKDTKVVFNTSNKEAVDQFTNNIVAYLKNHPEINIFDLWPPDGALWSDDSSSLKMGSPSDRQAILLNHVADIVGELFPKLEIESIAYQAYIAPPKHVQMVNPRIQLDFCPIARSFAHPIWDSTSPKNAYYDVLLKKWIGGAAFQGDMGYYSYYSKYAWRSLPVVIPHLIQREMSYLQSIGITGIGTYSEPGNWFTYEIDQYVIARCAWNAELHVDSLLANFLQKRYGHASKFISDYFKIIERTVPIANRLPHIDPPPNDSLKYFLLSFQNCDRFLIQARQVCAKESEATFLINKLALSIKYATLDIMIRQEALSVANKDLDNSYEDIAKLKSTYRKMAKLFDDNLDEGVFIRRRNYYEMWKKNE